MIGLVLVTHGRLAEEFIAATEHVVGPQPNMRAVSIGPDDDMEQRRRDILEAIEAVEAGQGVILLTDMFGGTPSNLAISMILGLLGGIGLAFIQEYVDEQNAERHKIERDDLSRK